MVHQVGGLAEQGATSAPRPGPERQSRLQTAERPWAPAAGRHRRQLCSRSPASAASTAWLNGSTRALILPLLSRDT